MPYKVLKGFILTNGFEGKVDDIVIDKEFTSNEIDSLLKDGSIEVTELGSGTENGEEVSKPKTKRK